MCYRTRKLDVTHTLTTDFCQCNLNATLLANNAAMLEALILATKTLVVLDRAKNFGAEQAVTLGLKGPVVDGLRLLHLAK